MTFWDDVPLLDGSPPAEATPEEILVVRGRRLAELPYSGWGFLIGWAFGAESLLRFIDDRLHLTRVTCIRNGVTTVSHHPWTSEERDTVEESVNSYLAEAGVPPSPPGYVWYLVLPETCATSRELWSELNVVGRLGGSPADLATPLREAAARLKAA